MTDLFPERVGSLADSDLRAPRSQEGSFVRGFIEAELEVDSRPEDEIDQDTGRPDGYNREAELTAMTVEAVKDNDTTEVIESV